mgnify:CR=1 FL=1|tara:strand:+ start:3557 stop:4276 length:720 start_codon:yes stop_codon:yes gene_type:complete
MSSQKILILDNNEIILTKSLKAKSVSISIKPFERVKVTVPFFISFKNAEDFVIKKKAWIKRNLLKLKSVEQNQTIFDFNTSFSTRNHLLKLNKVERNHVNYRLKDQLILVDIPNTAKVKSLDIQQKIRFAIEETLRKEAKDYLPKRVKELAEKNSFTFKNVSVRNSKTRWGSCSYDNNINLNLHLMRLPNHLIDYVILHELVHTKIKNHSGDFWNMLDLVTGNAKKLDKELKNYQTKIY